MALLQVEPLARLSLHALTGPLMAAVAADLEDEEGDDVGEEARRYLEAAPGAVLQELLNAVVPRTDLPARVRFAALRLLLRRDVASLSVGVLPKELHGDLVTLVGQRGAGLSTLDLKGAWLRGADMEALAEVLSGLGALRVLGVPHTATDQLLEAVGRHCPRLHALDVSGETRVSRRGLVALCTSPDLAASLQVVDIGNLGEMSVLPEDAAVLLRGLPNLLSLGTYAYVGAALESLDEPRTPLRLEYLRDTATTPRVADTMCRLCPALSAVYLDSPGRGVLPLLAGLPRLIDLKVHQPHVGDLLQLLESVPKLTELELLSCLTGPLDLSRVAALCPALTRLELHLVDCSTGTGAAMSWPALRSLGVFHSQLQRRDLLEVVRAAPRLRRLGVGCPLELEDGDVAMLCGEQLQEVWLAGAPRLGPAAVLCFLTGCPRLTSLGELSGWDLGPHDVDHLREHCSRSNLDVSLWYFPRSDQLTP